MQSSSSASLLEWKRTWSRVLRGKVADGEDDVDWDELIPFALQQNVAKNSHQQERSPEQTVRASGPLQVAAYEGQQSSGTDRLRLEVQETLREVDRLRMMRRFRSAIDYLEKQSPEFEPLSKTENTEVFVRRVLILLGQGYYSEIIGLLNHDHRALQGAFAQDDYEIRALLNVALLFSKLSVQNIDNDARDDDILVDIVALGELLIRDDSLGSSFYMTHVISLALPVFRVASIMLDESDLDSSLARARLEHYYHPALFLKSYIDSVEARHDWSDSLQFILEFLYTIMLEFQEAKEFRTIADGFLLKLDLNNVPESDQGMCYLFKALLDREELSGQAFQLAIQDLRISEPTWWLQFAWMFVAKGNECDMSDAYLLLSGCLSLSNDQRDIRASIEVRSEMAVLTEDPYEKLHHLDVLWSMLKRARIFSYFDGLMDLISQVQRGESDTASSEELRLTFGLPSSMQDAINASHTHMANGRFSDAIQIMTFNIREETHTNQMRVNIQRCHIYLTAGCNIPAKLQAEIGSQNREGVEPEDLMCILLAQMVVAWKICGCYSEPSKKVTEYLMNNSYSWMEQPSQSISELSVMLLHYRFVALCWVLKTTADYRKNQFFTHRLMPKLLEQMKYARRHCIDEGRSDEVVFSFRSVIRALADLFQDYGEALLIFYNQDIHELFRSLVAEIDWILYLSTLDTFNYPATFEWHLRILQAEALLASTKVEHTPSKFTPHEWESEFEGLWHGLGVDIGTVTKHWTTPRDCETALSKALACVTSAFGSESGGANWFLLVVQLLRMNGRRGLLNDVECDTLAVAANTLEVSYKDYYNVFRGYSYLVDSYNGTGELPIKRDLICEIIRRRTGFVYGELHWSLWVLKHCAIGGHHIRDQDHRSLTAAAFEFSSEYADSQELAPRQFAVPLFNRVARTFRLNIYRHLTHAALTFNTNSLVESFATKFRLLLLEEDFSIWALNFIQYWQLMIYSQFLMVFRNYQIPLARREKLLETLLRSFQHPVYNTEILEKLSNIDHWGLEEYTQNLEPCFWHVEIIHALLVFKSVQRADQEYDSIPKFRGLRDQLQILVDNLEEVILGIQHESIRRTWLTKLFLLKANFALGGFHFNETGLASQINLGGRGFDILGLNTFARIACGQADLPCGGGDALTYALQALSCTTEGSISMAHVCCWVGFCSLIKKGVPKLLLLPLRDTETNYSGENLVEFIQCFEEAQRIFGRNHDLDGVKQTWSCMTSAELLIAEARRAEAGYTLNTVEKARHGGVVSMVLDQHIFSQLVAFRDYYSHRLLLGLNAFDSHQPWTFMEALTTRICISSWLSMLDQNGDPAFQQDTWSFIQQLKARGLTAIVNDLGRFPVPSHLQRDPTRKLEYELLVRFEEKTRSSCLLHKRAERLLARLEHSDAVHKIWRFHKNDPSLNPVSKDFSKRLGLEISAYQPPSLDDIQCLPNIKPLYNLVLFDWLRGAGKYSLLITRVNDGQKMVCVLEITHEEIIQWLHKHELSELRDRALLQELYPLVEVPYIENFIEEDDLLVFAPTEQLHYLPLHALSYDKGKTMIFERHPVVYVSSMGLFANCVRRASKSLGDIEEATKQKSQAITTYVANEDIDLDQKVEQTSNRVANYLGVQPHASRSTVTFQSFKTACKSAGGILHFFGHTTAKTDEDNPQGLLLNEVQNDLVVVEDIFSFELKFEPHVVLIACGSSREDLGPRDEPTGLVSAFLKAGAASVLATLWPVHVNHGLTFCDAYYSDDGLGDREDFHRSSEDDNILDLARAWQVAVLKMYDEYEDNVAAWSGFVLNGSPFLQKRYENGKIGESS